MANKQQDLTAIIYDKRGRILSIGKNSYTKTHPLQAAMAKKVGREHAKFLHAEMMSIIKCKDISKAYRIAIFRYHKDGTEANAKPCKICEDAIRELTNIKIIEHT